MMEVLQQILHRLRPLGLEEFGLRASLQQLTDDWNRRAKGNTRFQLLFDEAIDHLPDNVAVTLYRIVQESVTNAVRHGRASEVDVCLTVDHETLRLQISDNGRGGIAPDPSSESRKSGGFGLLGMEERVLALGGTLRILPREPQGTVIDVNLPAGEQS
jgi:protein-histidine pros-kinase